MPVPWRVLQLASSDFQLPPLLVSTEFTPNSYTINLSDLTNIWSEFLDRRSVIRRSLDQYTSIDPSENGEQLRVLLQKIQLAVSRGKGTSISLEVKATNPENQLPHLTLHLRAILPKPLKPLEWSLFLKPVTQSLLTTRLTIPLLQVQNIRNKELDDMLDVIKDKDHVIQKLLDKVEATGTELGDIFPGAAGRGGRKINRAVAEERVKGLSAFDRDSWQRNRNNAKRGLVNIEDLVTDVFPSSVEHVTNVQDSLGVPESWDKWWARIEGKTLDINETITDKQSLNQKVLSIGSNNHGRPNTMQGDDDADDFQVQATPPSRFKKQAPSSPLHPVDPPEEINDSTEEDDDDLDAASQRSAVPDSYPPTTLPKSKPKLGAIGSSKLGQISKPESPKYILIEKETIVDAEADDDTATEGDASPSPKVAPRKRAPSPGKPIKGSLGKIGGKKKEPTPPSSSIQGQQSEISTRPKPKLGVIGQKSKTTTSTSRNTEDATEKVVDTETRGRSSAKKEPSPQPRETSQERADRKREELKKELEEKAKAPAKKKRKF